MTIFILVFAIIIGVFQNIFSNIFSKKYLHNISDNLLFNLIIFLSGSLFLLIFIFKSNSFNFFTIMLGSLLGITSVLTQFFYLKALSTGPLSYSSLFLSCGLIIPVFCGIFIWNEKTTFLQIIGLILLLVSFYFGINPQKDDKLTWKWFFYSFLSFLFGGSVGLIQKAYQQSEYNNNMNELITVAFLVATFISLLFYLYYINIPKVINDFKLKSNATLFGLGVGFSYAIAHKVNLFLVGKIPATIFFPVLNGAIMIILAITSIFIFKEKLSFWGRGSIIIAIIALLLISKII